MSALRDLRRARHVTLEELGRRVGLGKMRLSDLERGKWPQTWRRLCRMADTLGSTTDEVLGRAPLQAAVLPEINAQDAELLAAMERSFDHYFDSPTLRRTTEPGVWRGLAHMTFCGALCKLRQDGTLPAGPPRPPTSPAVGTSEKLPPAPPGWHTGWESDRLKAERLIEESGKRRRQIAAAKARL